jgi:hypothetical protein
MFSVDGSAPGGKGNVHAFESRFATVIAAGKHVSTAKQLAGAPFTRSPASP